MKDNKFKKGIEELKKIKLTEQEKTSSLNNIQSRIDSAGLQPEHVTGTLPCEYDGLTPPNGPMSPYGFGRPIFAWMRSSKWSSIVSLVVIIALIGSGIANAAQKALPGDALYAIKTDLIEPVSVALASTPKAKAEIQIKIATTRLIEAETMAEQNRLDEKTVEKLSNYIDNNSKAVASALEKVRETHSTDDLETDYQASMSAHAKILTSIVREKIATSSDHRTVMKLAENARSKADKNFAETENSSQLMSAATVASPAVDTATRAMVGSVSSEKSLSETGDEDQKKSYENDRQRVNAIVEKTLTNIRSVADDVNILDENTVNSVKETVDQAQVKIEKAERAIKNGDTSEAHASLKESEKSIKEASILFDNGVKKAKEKAKDKNSDRNKNNNNEKNSGGDSRRKDARSEQSGD